MTARTEQSSSHLHTAVAAMMLPAVVLVLTLLGGISWQVWQRNHQLARIEALRTTASSELADQQLMAQHYRQQIATSRNATAAILARYADNATTARYIGDLARRAQAEQLTVVQLAPSGYLSGYPPVTTYAIQLRGRWDSLLRWLADATRNAPAACCLAEVSLRADGQSAELAVSVHSLAAPSELLLTTGPDTGTSTSAGSRDMEIEP
mgnify:FL=1